MRTCSCFVHRVGIAGSFLGQARQLPGTVCVEDGSGSQKNSPQAPLVHPISFPFFFSSSNCWSALPLQNHRTTSSSSSSFLCCNTEQRVEVRTEGESCFLSRVRTGSCVLLLFFFFLCRINTSENKQMDQENIGFTLSGTQTAHVHPLICTEIAQMLI